MVRSDVDGRDPTADQSGGSGGSGGKAGSAVDPRAKMQAPQGKGRAQNSRRSEMATPTYEAELRAGGKASWAVRSRDLPRATRVLIEILSSPPLKLQKPKEVYDWFVIFVFFFVIIISIGIFDR